jgi:hypothetical protein
MIDQFTFYERTDINTKQSHVCCTSIKSMLEKLWYGFLYKNFIVIHFPNLSVNSKIVMCSNGIT